MKNVLLATSAALILSGGMSVAGTVDASQNMLNRLGYNAGPVDGSYGGKTRTALEKFYADNGSSYDGKLDANEVADLTAAIDAAGLNKHANISITDQHRYDNFPGIVDFSLSKSVRDSWFGYTWLTSFDTTDDGHDDLIFYSDSPNAGVTGKDSSNAGDLRVSPYLPKWKDFDLIDSIQSKKTTLAAPFQKFADMNGDGRLDIIVASSYWDPIQSRGRGGAYVFFNKGDGTFKSKRVSRDSFTHAMGVGDLDNDGDQDIIYQHLSGRHIVCEMNDGRGKFTRVNCMKTPTIKNHGWTQPMWGFRVADFDNDGYTDMAMFGEIGDHTLPAHGGNRRQKQMENPMVFWGNGSATFKFNRSTELNMDDYSTKAYKAGKHWFGNTYAGATVDFQNDGDVDIVAIAIGGHSVGGAIVAFENQGNRKFKRKEIYRSTFLAEDPKRFRKMQNQLDKTVKLKDYTWLTEGIIWNQVCGNPMFKDLNSDGNVDFFCGGSVREMSNSEITDRWENHQKLNQRYAPLQNPSDWDPSWSTNHVYSILDKDLNVIDAGKIFEESRHFINKYEMNYIGYNWIK